MLDSRRMTLRLPSYLRKWLEGASKNESRTMTGHIIEILKKEKEKQEEKEIVT